MTALHKLKDGKEGGWSRFKMFIVVFCGAFCYYFFPGWIFPALTYFSWATWIAPDNIKLNQLMGGTDQGLAMGSLTFDWLEVTYLTSPLVTPYWAQVNIMSGFIGFVWLIAPVLYYNNVFHAAYMPLISNTSFDRFGKKYNVSAILTPG